MDRLNLALTSPPKFVLPGYSSTSSISTATRTNQLCGSRRLASSRIKSPPRIFASAVNRRPSHRIVVAERFASVSSSSTTSNQSSSVGVPSVSVPPPSSYVGSPLFWVGVGVGLSALFTWVASYLKRYAMQQAFKTMMSQMNSQNSPMTNPPSFGAGSPFPIPPTFGTGTAVSPSVSEPAASIDVTATKVEDEPVTNVKNGTENKEAKQFAFVDVAPEETDEKSPFKEDATDTSVSKSAQPTEELPQNGAASKPPFNIPEGSPFSRKPGSVLSVDAVEKMMEDPTVQKMIYPHLPEEMRNPETFKWMMQNPQYRQQLEDMLNNMSGSPQWDDRLMDSMKNFDLSSPEVKQQFDQIGLTPEEVISKIMANPEIAMAFQNPRVQAAIMDCSQNPLSITKYQNDKEVMDVFNKISELFPGVSGAP